MEEEYNEEQPQEQELLSPTMIASQDPNLVKWLEDSSDVMMELRKTYLNLVYDEKKKDYIQKEDSEALMTEEGANNLISELNRLSKVVTFSNLDDEEIRRIAKEARGVVIDLIAQNYKNFEIRFSNFDKITYLTDHLIFCNLKRAQAGQERNKITGISRYLEQIGTKSNQSNKRMLGLFNK